MSIKQGKELAKYLKDKKNLLLLVGELAEEVDFGSRKLLDYAADIAGKLKLPVAATGNTYLALREKEVSPISKMWASEIVNYMRFAWQEDISKERPEILILIGYPPVIADNLVSMVNNAETIVLGNTYIESATYSLPDSYSLHNWEHSLQDLINALVG